MAGPFAEDRGALLVYLARSSQEAALLVEHDPFAVENVFAGNEMFEWSIKSLNVDLLTMQAP